MVVLAVLEQSLRMFWKRVLRFTKFSRLARNSFFKVSSRLAGLTNQLFCPSNCSHERFGLVQERTHLQNLKSSKIVGLSPCCHEPLNFWMGSAHWDLKTLKKKCCFRFRMVVFLGVFLDIAVIWLVAVKPIFVHLWAFEIQHIFQAKYNYVI